MQHDRVDCVLGITARKQPGRGPRQAPIRAQDAEQLRRQHDIPITAALALFDADDHAAAVDVANLEARRFGGAQPGRIRRGQRGPRLQARHRLQEAHDLVGAEHHRQLLRLSRIRNALRQLRLPERHAVEETKGANGLVQRRPRYSASDQMHLESADVLQIQLLGGASEEAAKLCNGMHIRSLCRRRQIADRHVLDHAATQRAHLGHRGSPVPGLGQHPTPGRPNSSHSQDRRLPLARQRVSSIPEVFKRLPCRSAKCSCRCSAITIYQIQTTLGDTQVLCEPLG
jgi:hypothetical protein